MSSTDSTLPALLISPFTASAGVRVTPASMISTGYLLQTGRQDHRESYRFGQGWGQRGRVAMVKDLIATVDREKAKIGVFVTLTSPTKPMEKEAVTAGFYQTDYGKFPKIQIMTIEDLFDGKKPYMPWLDPKTFKKAAREDRSRKS